MIRKILFENYLLVSGMEAIKKSQQNNDIREKYMDILGKAQNKVEEMFGKSIQDAKNAFKISSVMNMTSSILA